MYIHLLWMAIVRMLQISCEQLGFFWIGGETMSKRIHKLMEK